MRTGCGGATAATVGLPFSDVPDGGQQALLKSNAAELGAEDSGRRQRHDFSSGNDYYPPRHPVHRRPLCWLTAESSLYLAWTATINLAGAQPIVGTTAARPAWLFRVNDLGEATISGKVTHAAAGWPAGT